jgi:dienelactone hydrolase
MRSSLIQAAALLAPILTLGSESSAAPTGGKAPEVVQIRTADSQTLEAAFYRPKAPRSPGALLIHDAGADRSQLEPLAARLVRQGFGVLLVDLRGHGGSKSAKLDWSAMSESERKGTWSYAPRDVDAAADWLLGQPTIHSTSLSVVGYGAGCALIVRHAQRDENVMCMALLAPNEKDYGFDVKGDIQSLEGLPTYVAALKNDEAAIIAQQANAHSVHEFVKLQLYSSRLTSPLEDKEMPRKVSKWLAETAKPKKGGSHKKRGR